MGGLCRNAKLAVHGPVDSQSQHFVQNDSHGAYMFKAQDLTD